MTNDTTHEALAASIAARDAFLDWRIAVDMNVSPAQEALRFAWYQYACVKYRSFTGREYMPVLWGAS
jgi:hypothetical protein